MQKYILQLGELTWSKVIVAGLLVGAGYWLMYFDNGAAVEAEIATLGTRLTDSEKRLKDTKEAMADAERFEKLLRANEIQFEKVMEYLPQDTNSNELTRIVSTTAQNSQAQVRSTTPMQATERKEFYEMTRIKFTLAGGFSQLVRFLSEMSKIPKLLTFDKLEIKTEPNAGKIGEGETPIVMLEAVLVGYRYLKEEETAANKAAEKGGAGAAQPK